MKNRKRRRERKDLPPDLKKRLREGKVKIKVASRDKSDEYSEEVGVLLHAMGISSALVTDESTIGDFDGAFDDIDELSEAVGVPLSMDDHVWEVAKRIREKTALN